MFANPPRHALVIEGAAGRAPSAEGDQMQNSKDLHSEPQALLEEIGGESLAGSGFETEQPDEGFGAEEPAEKAEG
jgi:hypothetical protein